MTSRGGGHTALTGTKAGLFGSSDSISMVAASGPNVAGVKRIGSSYESPGPMVIGSAAMEATSNVALLATIDVTVSGHVPEFVSMISLSRCSPRQAVPSSPPVGVDTSSAGAPTVTDAVTSTNGAFGSLLAMRTTACSVMSGWVGR